ncbi:putative ABC transporter permease subunit [Clostridium saccharobutylicum]|uniref:ABC-2 type transport system permease protein n=1 Tax=Clostridium saccharobutylicum DSM 13864 TaxID=1345695 RepID=U5MQW6_CLOSA|nr:hypothetical protein [Clostridium saccharobutylicum]AGX43204.1 hypothetical protein CLSA_c22270 [Clostridium saccharobutylicum DSM 13864]AQR90503.1 hypothetical protein CLOSC_22220 [Clostridium saccharobutylicum]AQS00409.1 hypothetical protein CSACC_22290 [Clostridium saccharobutylicum]AQS14392.1 hypothetical protein CLOSACC_22290 [Clostridium saccharobutylicum]MBA2906867.1 ABC-2 type transport system permease protein [Clostridium saccharobutylicum]
MKRLKIITKYFIRNALDEMFAGSKLKPVFIVILMIFTVSMLSMPFTIMVGESYKSFHSMGQEGTLLATVLSLGSAVFFFFGIYTIMNVFYFSQDIEVILPLPFKSSEIVFGKFAAVLINMYIYDAMMILPLAAYGIVSSANLTYYIYAIIVLIVTPILPMIFASVICMILMRFTTLSKHKDAFKMLTGCLSLIIIILFNYFTSGSGRNMNSDQILKKLSEGNNSVMDMTIGIFLTNKFSAYALVYNNELKGLLYILLSLALSILIFILYYYIGGKLYLKGIVGISESYSRREDIIKNGKASKLIRTNSPLKALIKRDIKVLLRTPQFFVNCVAMIFYMPAILGMTMFSGDNLSKYRVLLNQGTSWYSITIAVSFIGGTICIMTGGAASTALSREGKDFIVSKYIPIDYKIQLYSKILSSLCINEIGAIIIALGLILVKASPILLLLGIISAIGSIVLITFFGLYLDFRSPKLSWDNERAMLKSNYMPLIIMLIAFILGVILVLASIFLKNYIIIFIIAMAIILIGSSILYKMLVKLAYKVYCEI